MEDQTAAVTTMTASSAGDVRSSQRASRTSETYTIVTNTEQQTAAAAATTIVSSAGDVRSCQRASQTSNTYEVVTNAETRTAAAATKASSSAVVVRSCERASWTSIEAGGSRSRRWSDASSLPGGGGADRREIREFVQSHGLAGKADVFERAAALLELDDDDVDFARIPGITAAEVKALDLETAQKWRQPAMLYFTISVCSIGAIEQGWAQSSMNGANLYFPAEFGIGSSGFRDTLVVGLINSGIYLSTGLVGAWLSEPINNRMGRRGAVFVGCLICLFANIASALSQNWPQLLGFRFALGIGLGISASTVSVFAAECAPATIRGGLAVSWQMWTAFGIFMGFVANIGAFYVGEITWRLQLVAPVVPTLPLLILIDSCPESPAWLIKKSARYDLAFLSLCRLRNTELQAARDVCMAYLQQKQQQQLGLTTKPPFLTQLSQLYSIPRIRRATLASFTVMISQQLCGINIIAFYSSSIFSGAGFSRLGALLASCVFGLVNFLGAFPAVWTMDVLGRRSLLLLTLPFMALTMLGAGLSFAIPEEAGPAHFAVLATLVYVFCALYSPGMGPVPNTYSAEVFPLSHREIGMSLAVATANVWAAVLSLTFPRLEIALRPQGAFMLYACLNVVAFLLVFLFVPETRQRSLEDLDDVFSIRTRDSIRYQVVDYMPWLARRYILRQDVDDIKPPAPEGGYTSLFQDDPEDEV